MNLVRAEQSATYFTSERLVSSNCIAEVSIDRANLKRLPSQGLVLAFP
ncbi:MAG: hypothetical protein J7641_23580 [Cyanobacteria bacterium SID2]|nr:hypothetical protein [Cyanobacteria bacterium SID2]